MKMREIDRLLSDVRDDLEADHDRTFHNTMRFDLNLAHIQPMIDMEMVDKDKLAEAIRLAILGAIERETSEECDVVHCVRNAMCFRPAKTEMLHHEIISIDFS